ncbi:MAG TPA: chemotaxis protein CheW [Candidatus Binatia bacterium]|nr:chemotaxis protein CheW [Candidatus Binatia bacterium]
MTAVAPGQQDCWNHIGVRGDHSCPQLQVHVHCRNCPVFAAGALALLDRPPPAGYREEWTAHLSEPARELELDTYSIIAFRLGREWLALPTSVFEEVAEMRPVHSLPHVRNGALLGLVNVRGELLACVSLARLLGVEADAAGGEGHALRRMLVMQYEGGRAVFPADEVFGIHRFHARALQDPPATVTGGGTSFTLGLLPWRGQSLGVLDDTRVCEAIDRSLSSASAI